MEHGTSYMVLGIGTSDLTSGVPWHRAALAQNPIKIFFLKETCANCLSDLVKRSPGIENSVKASRGHIMAPNLVLSISPLLWKYISDMLPLFTGDFITSLADACHYLPSASSRAHYGGSGINSEWRPKRLRMSEKTVNMSSRCWKSRSLQSAVAGALTAILNCHTAFSAWAEWENKSGAWLSRVYYWALLCLCSWN